MDTVAALHELAAGIEHLRDSRYYIVAPVAVLYYDWLLTLSMEIERFWKQRLTGPTVLFLCNRYFPIMCFFPIMGAYFSDLFSSEACAKRFVPFVIASNVISQSIIGLILLLRTYALYQRSNTVLILVGMTWTAATAIGIWGGSSLTHLELPPGIPGCLVHAPDESRYRLAAAYVASLAYDALVYALTLWKTLSIRLARSRSLLSGDSLLCLVLRDGSIYFFVLMGAHSATILLVCLAEPDWRTFNLTFTHVIPITVTSRLLLNLRKDLRNGSARSTPHATIGPELTISIGISEGSDFMGTILGNLGDDFEYSLSPAESSPRSWSSSQVHPWESGYESDCTGGAIPMQSTNLIEVSSLRMEKPRTIWWDEICASGVNE